MIIFLHLRRAGIVGAMRGSVLALSRHVYGCRFVQHVLRAGVPDLMAVIAEEVRGNVPALCADANANHVLQVAVETVRVSGVQGGWEGGRSR